MQEESNNKGPNNTPSPKSKKKKEDNEKALRDILSKDVEAAAEKLSELIAKQATPGLSRNDRHQIQMEVIAARKVLEGVRKSADKAAAELKESRKLEAQAYAKLNRIKTWKAMSGAGAGYDDMDQLAIKQTEESLKRLIETLAEFRKGDGKNEDDTLDVRRELAARFDEVSDRIWSMPQEWQDMFASEDTKLDKILKQQAEAKKFVVEQNAALSKFAWSVADRMGVGAFNLGNVVRGGRAMWNAPKAAKRRFDTLADKFGTAKAYVQRTIEMRKLSKADPVDLMTEGDESNKETKKQSKLMERFFSASERFKSRLLDKLGKKKKGPQAANDDSFSKGFLDLFGKGGFLKTLLGLAAKLTGIAIAGAIGYWVGSKIWEKIAPSMAEKFDKLSGNDAAGKKVTGPIVLNTQDNHARAIDIQNRVNSPKGRFTNEEINWLEKYKNFNNIEGQVGSAYKPSASVQVINDKMSTGGFSRMDRNTLTSTPELSSTAGGGRGSVNPASVVPVATSAPSTPAPIMTTGSTVGSGGGSMKVSDWVGKTMTKSGGDVDVNGLQPGMQANMVNMSKEYYAKTGKKLQINSAFRSNAKQEELFRTMPKGMAAPPGSSLHNFGLAFDVNSAQANELHNLGLLQKFGFTRPIQKEPWHVQPVGMTLAAAKSGIYSADGPANQGEVQSASATPQEQSVASAEPRIPLTTSSGETVGTGSGGKVGTLGGGAKNSASSIPTFESTDGLLLGMNLGALGS
jgi:hypothetical protein